MRGLFAPVMCALLVIFCVALFVPTTSATAAHDGDHAANETAKHADAGHAEPEPTPETEPEPTTGDHEGSGEHEPNAETEPQPKTDKAAQAAEEAENGGSHVGTAAPLIISLAFFASVFKF